jgi:RNA polymerase sigma-70 factor (family 1)
MISKGSRYGVGSLIRGRASYGLSYGKRRPAPFFSPYSETPLCSQHLFAIVSDFGNNGTRYADSPGNWNEAAFDCLFRDLFAPLTYFAVKLIKEPFIAEDIVQDCFVKLWEKRLELGHIKTPKSYLYQVVRNSCLKHLERSKQSSSEPEEDLSDPDPVIEKSLIAAETARELYQFITSLSPALQQIIRLYYLEGMTNREIATALNIEPDSVIRQRLRAIMALRKMRISL